MVFIYYKNAYTKIKKTLFYILFNEKKNGSKYSCLEYACNTYLIFIFSSL